MKLLIKIIIAVIIGAYLLSLFLPEIPPEKLAEIKAQEQQRLAQEAEDKTKKEAEDKRKGFHCLNSWNGSHRGVENFVSAKLNNPDSFEHVETRITPIDENGEHFLTMTYRGTNAFGGVVTQQATAVIQNKDCSAVVDLQN